MMTFPECVYGAVKSQSLLTDAFCTFISNLRHSYGVYVDGRMSIKRGGRGEGVRGNEGQHGLTLN